MFRIFKFVSVRLISCWIYRNSYGKLSLKLFKPKALNDNYRKFFYICISSLKLFNAK